MSRLLSGIDARLRDETSPIEVGRLRIRRAIYKARDGEFESANSEIALIRDLASMPSLAELAAGANLAEAVIATYSDDKSRAFEKLRRAAAIAAIGRDSWLRHLVWAWQAFSKTFFWRPEGVEVLARAILAECDQQAHDVRSRLFSTVAVGLHFADRYDLARTWYEAARFHAIEEGDDLTIDANLHNVAALRLHNIRIGEIDGAQIGSDLDRAKMELSSSLSFDYLKSGTTIRWSLPLHRARMALLTEGRGAALPLFQSWIESFAASAGAYHVVSARADLALCLTEAGLGSDAIASIRRAQEEMPAEAGDDELAMLHFRAAQVLESGGAGQEAAMELQYSTARLRRFRQLQQIVGTALACIESPRLSAERSRASS